MTIEQLEALGKMNSSVRSDRNFIGTLFKKIHHDKLDPERISDLTFEQRREELIEMYNAAKDHPQSFRTALLHEILEMGVKLDIYDKDLFLQYIQHPQTTWYLNDKKHNSGYQDTTWNNYINSVQLYNGNMQWDQMGKLYYTYLENFYIQFEGNLKAF